LYESFADKGEKWGAEATTPYWTGKTDDMPRCTKCLAGNIGKDVGSVDGAECSMPYNRNIDSVTGAETGGVATDYKCGDDGAFAHTDPAHNDRWKYLGKCSTCSEPVDVNSAMVGTDASGGECARPNMSTYGAYTCGVDTKIGQYSWSEDSTVNDLWKSQETVGADTMAPPGATEDITASSIVATNNQTTASNAAPIIQSHFCSNCGTKLCGSQRHCTECGRGVSVTGYAD